MFSMQTASKSVHGISLARVYIHFLGKFFSMRSTRCYSFLFSICRLIEIYYRVRRIRQARGNQHVLRRVCAHPRCTTDFRHGGSRVGGRMNGATHGRGNRRSLLLPFLLERCTRILVMNSVPESTVAINNVFFKPARRPRVRHPVYVRQLIIEAYR